MSFTLTSSAFEPNTKIPSQYTCDGADISPPLSWQGAPTQTTSYALIMDDPDAPMGTWDHWLLFNIPAHVQALPEAFQQLQGSALGKNTWGNMAYGGPCPPSGTHRYFFKLYALDTLLHLQGFPNKAELMDAMKNHILAKTELIGLYAKM